MHKTFIRDDSQIEANHDYILLLFPLSKLRTLDQEPGVTELNPYQWRTLGHAPSARHLAPRAISIGVGDVWIDDLMIGMFE